MTGNNISQNRQHIYLHGAHMFSTFLDQMHSVTLNYSLSGESVTSADASSGFTGEKLCLPLVACAPSLPQDVTRCCEHFQLFSS